MDAKKGNGLGATNDQPAETQSNNAPDFIATPATIGAFPNRHNTVCAEVLALLLCGENLTGLDAVYRCNTTRLAATICYLGKKHNWTIDRVDIHVGTNDGRVEEVTVYYFSRATIRRAFDAGALLFCQSVKEARAKTRKDAPKAKAEANKRNAARAALKFNVRQMTLEF